MGFLFMSYGLMTNEHPTQRKATCEHKGFGGRCHSSCRLA